jgi:hypothetical protein
MGAGLEWFTDGVQNRPGKPVRYESKMSVKPAWPEASVQEPISPVHSCFERHQHGLAGMRGQEAIVSFALIEVRSKEEALELSKRFWAIVKDGEGDIRQVYGPES